MLTGEERRRQEEMRLKPGSPAPLFVSRDVYGRQVELANYTGFHLLLSFYRAAVCPLCTLRFAHLVDRAPDYARQGLAMVAVFESSPPETVQYIHGLQLPFPVIGNVDGHLYGLYGLEASLLHAAWGWLARRPAFREAARRRLGGTMWQNLTQTRGQMGRLPGDFLIGPDLRIEVAYYGHDAGDFLLFRDLDAYMARLAAAPRPERLPQRSYDPRLTLQDGPPAHTHREYPRR
jgi:thioredoxin-dependent peroxiredoxin